MKYFIILLALLSGQAKAGIGELMAGGTYRRVEYEDPTITSKGVSVSYRHLFLAPGSSGPFFEIESLGYSIYASQLFAGWIYRSKGSVFFDLGAAASYRYNYGPGVGVYSGIGFDLGGGWHLAVTLLFRYPGRAGFFVKPLIGWRF